MFQNKKVVVFIPAYNTELTLEKTVKALPKDIIDTILVVNDGSRDKTEEIAKNLDVHLVNHEVNKGYGAAQKTGYTEAIKLGADIVVMVHSDFQYDPTLLPKMVEKLASTETAACFGSRMHVKGEARKGGMPWWRFVANIALTKIEEAVLHLGLSEYHTGYRAYTKEFLQKVPFEKNSNNYVFDTEMLAELSLGDFKVTEIGIPTRYTEESKSPNFRQSVVYGFMTLDVMSKCILHRMGIKKYEKFEIKK